MTDEELYEKLCRWCPNKTRCHEECDVCDEYLVLIESEPTSAVNDIGSDDGENEMNDSLPSDNNINRRKMQVKKVNMGDFARLYLKGIYSDYKDEAFNVYYVVNTLYALKELEQKADAPKWLFDEIKDAFFTKWSAMEIEVEDDA